MSAGGMPPYTRRVAEIAHIWRSPKRRELMEELQAADVFEIKLARPDANASPSFALESGVA